MARFIFNARDNELASPNFQNPRTLTGTVNGINKVFTFSSNPGPSYMITLGGAIMHAGVDYTVAGLTVTFTNAPIVAPVGYW